MRDLSPRNLMAIFATLAVISISVSILSSGEVAIISIVLVGFFNSILFPALFTMSINGLGHLAEEGASVLISSIVGGAIVPILVIYAAKFSSFKISMIIPIICYIYIVYFSLFGSRFKKIKVQEVQVLE
jgi:FHS family L-fucose permease-like MFS transporter